MSGTQSLIVAILYPGDHAARSSAGLSNVSSVWPYPASADGALVEAVRALSLKTH